MIFLSMKIDTENYNPFWTIAAKNTDKSDMFYFTNLNISEFKKFYEANKKDIWIGKKIKSELQYYIKCILLDLDPINLYLHIQEGKYIYKFSDKFNKIPLYFYDLDFENTEAEFLKLGLDSCENKKDLFAAAEKEINSMMELFINNYQDFKLKMDLLKYYKLPLKDLGNTIPKIAAKILECDLFPKQYDDDFQVDILENINLGQYEDVKNYFAFGKADLREKIYISNMLHVIGWGGLHSGEKCEYEGIIVHTDAQSFYPSIIKNYDLFSRNINNPFKYDEIYNERIKLKNENNSLEKGLKYILNSTWGAMKDRFNSLYDPKMCNTVAANGQLFLIDLIDKLEGNFKLIQANTDGLIFKIDRKSKIDLYFDICQQWEKRTRLKLNHKFYNKIIQRDVNNYILLGDQENKFVGGAFKDIKIINQALENYFINGIDPEITINKSTKLIDFQKIINLNTFDYFIHGENIIYDCSVRVFASRSKNDPELLKVRDRQKNKIGLCPNNIFIDNTNIIDQKTPLKLDRKYYIDYCNKKIKDWS